MSRSQSFDRAADFYDQTRELPEAMLRRGVPLILERAGAGGRILDVGTGTGRISAPLIERGARLFGCDLSRPMMARLRAKQPAARLAQADAVHLPFAAGLFDLVLTTHVMHLVAGWQAALREIRRVLRRGGLYISTGAVEAGTAPFAAVRDWWRDRVNALGAEWRRPGIESREELLGAARALGGSVETVEIEHLTESRFSLAELIDSLSRRVSSDTWNVPDAVLTQSVAETRAWAAQAYGDLDRRPPTDTRLVLDLISFDE